MDRKRLYRQAWSLAAACNCNMLLLTLPPKLKDSSVFPFNVHVPGHAIGDRMVNLKDGMIFAWVPAGDFLYGDKRERKYVGGFWIAQTCVTQNQYKSFCDATGHKKPNYFNLRQFQGNCPVFAVNYHEACEYAAWAGCTIPSQEMWEKAARGTDGRIFPWGNKFKNSMCNTSADSRKYGYAPVGSFPSDKSIYGCFDMAGNIVQWTSSQFIAMDRMFKQNRFQVTCGADYGFTDPNLSRCASRGDRLSMARLNEGIRLSGPVLDKSSGRHL